MECTTARKQTAFSFRRLTEASLDIAVTLCNSCVGENLYPRAQLARIIQRPDHFFYFLFTPEGEAAGYIYFFLTDLEEMAILSRLPREQLDFITKQEHPVIGNLQSIGVAKAYRKQGISGMLVDFYLSYLQKNTSADVAFGVFWKAMGQVPMEKTLLAFDFIYLADAQGVWQDKENLVCPYCQGRCTCWASLYYKPCSAVEHNS